MIIIMGSVGSGKTEQASRLANYLKCPHISTSRLLRDNLTPEQKSKMRDGALISDQEVLQLLDKQLKKVDAAFKQCILDGSPRSVTQAKWLVDKLNANQIKLDLVVKLNVSAEVAIDRLQKRARDDDKNEVILRRLATWTTVTAPAIAYLRKHGVKVYEVNGELNPEEVEQEILRAISRSI